MLKFKDLNINPKGIIHIGAHLGEEKEQYGNIPVIWVEGNPRIIGRLRCNVGNDPVIPCIVSNIVKTTVFNIATESSSSSLYEFKRHKKYYPKTDVLHKIIVSTKPFSLLIRELNIKMRKYNFLVISAGGSELEVLQGFDRYLNKIDYILTKIYDEEIYKDCKNIDSINHYLKQQGFALKTKKVTNGWGRAFYIRDAFIPQ